MTKRVCLDSYHRNGPCLCSHIIIKRCWENFQSIDKWYSHKNRSIQFILGRPSRPGSCLRKVLVKRMGQFHSVADTCCSSSDSKSLRRRYNIQAIHTLYWTVSLLMFWKPFATTFKHLFRCISLNYMYQQKSKLFKIPKLHRTICCPKRKQLHLLLNLNEENN